MYLYKLLMYTNEIFEKMHTNTVKLSEETPA